MSEANVNIYAFRTTPIGKYKLSQATSGGIPVNLTHLAVGDGGGSEYVPTKEQTVLKHETWRGEIESKTIHPDDPNIVIVIGSIPDNVGGFFIRELTLIDEDGDSIYISEYPTSYKPMPGSNVSKDMIIEQWLVIEDAESITLTPDTNVCRATKKDLSDHNHNPKAHPDLHDAANIKQTSIAIPGKESPSVEDALGSLNENTISKDLLGQPSGVATLDESGKVPSNQLPSISSGGIGQNLLINAWFAIWQRGTKFVSPIWTYTADRWQCFGTGTFSGTVEKVADGMKIIGNIEMKQIMEDSDYNQIANRIATLSYSVDGEVITRTVVITSPTVVHIGLANCTINWIKLELGNIATPFVPRPIAEELALCQRYYEKIMPGTNFGRYGIGQSYSLTVIDVIIATNNTKRVRPTVRFSGNIWVCHGSQFIAKMTSLGIVNMGNGFVAADINVASGLTDKTTYILANNSDVTAYIELDAEL